MIRQAISCDICAAEKRQTNHWFVTYEQGGELRVSGWTSRHRLKPDSKHLCGQTCLHKLIDEFIARSIAGRAQRSGEAAEMQVEASAATDTSLLHATAIESSAHLLSAPKAAPPRSPAPISKPAPAFVAQESPAERPHPGLVTMTARPFPKDLAPAPVDAMRYASRRWHAEAWERERERELRAADNRSESAPRRRTSA
jgi:hypothetical protein